jgi:hypothetical protein
MKRLLTLLFFAFFAITTQAQTVPDLPSGSVPFGTGLFRDPDGDIWGGSKFDGYVNLGNWQRVADSLGVKINWSDTTIIASKEWVEGKLNSLPPSGVLSVTGDGVDNTDPANPVLSYPDPSDIGALAPGDDISELTNDAGYLTGETDPVYSGDPASSITQNDIDEWDAKQDAITGAATTVVSNNLTPSRALISNGSGKIAVSPVSAAELAFLDGVSSNVQDQLDAKIPLAQKGASNGVAPIGNDGKIPGEYLPSSGSYKGTWDASTNTPTIADGVGTNGDRYRVAVGGTVDLGSGPITFVAGDDVIYNGTVWQRSPSGVTVTSVAGKTGDVVLDKNDVGLGNVDNTSDLDKPISTAVQNALDLKLDASEISNYYTKTQMQTSGQAQLHWDNITNVPGGLGAQTLSLGSLSGEISISGGNSVRLNSLYRGDSFSGDISELSGGSGLYTLHVISGATGFPTGQGSAVYFSRSTFPGTNGSFMLFAPTGNTNKMYYTTGSSDQTWLPFQTFASEGWVNNNYYTKTNLQTSGQAQVHWGNITNVPSGLGLQTLSLGSGAGNIGISDGNSVSLNSLIYTLYQDHDAHTLAGFYPRRNETGSTGYPSANGGGVRFIRSSSSFSGAFEFWKNSGNDGELYFNVGTGTNTWKGFERVASKEFTAANYFSTSPATQGGSIQNIGTNDVFGVTNAGVFRSLSGASNAPNSTNSFSYLNLYGGSTSTAMLAFYNGGPGYAPEAPYYNNRPGSASWVQLASVPWVLSQPFGAITQTDIDNWNEAASYAAPETVVSTTVNFTINWQSDIAPNSGGKTYAEVHGNHFTYSAFYEDGSGGEVNYSPAVKITRNGSGAITTVQFGDIQTGNIVIK